MPRRYCACVLCAIAAAVAYFLLFGQPQSATAQEGKVSFINDVAPILKENCFACHDAKKKSGKFEMTTYEKLMAGGANGEPILAGKPKESEFHDLIVTSAERRMPPRDKGEAVPKDRAAVIAKWITEGAKLDGGLDAEGRHHQGTTNPLEAPRAAQGLPFPGHRQCPRLHAGRQTPRDRRPPRTDSVGNRLRQTRRSASTPAPNAPMR